MKNVADGQQVEIPALWHDRTVGTHMEGMCREWEYRCKRSRRTGGKTPVQEPRA